MGNKREFIDYETAVSMLPDKEEIHTFRQSAMGVLLGADWGRKDILELLSKHQVELAGETATGMNHGLVVRDGIGFVFVETRNKK